VALLDLAIRSVMRLIGAVLGTIALALAAVAAEIPRAERRSGYELMSRETRAMQDDDTANPGFLWVLEGEALWRRRPAPPPGPARTATVTPGRA
jgi:hypothetical protein